MSRIHLPPLGSMLHTPSGYSIHWINDSKRKPERPAGAVLWQTDYYATATIASLRAETMISHSCSVMMIGGESTIRSPTGRTMTPFSIQAPNTLPPMPAETGNGVLLYKMMESGAEPAEASALIQSYFSGGNMAICSSEMFVLLNRDAWRMLLTAVRGAGCELHIVFFVRDLYPFFLSSYDQQVKGQGLSIPFKDWVPEWRWSHLDFLKMQVP